MGPNFGYRPFTEALHGLEKLPLALAEFQWGFVGHVPAASQCANQLARANVLALRDHVKRNAEEQPLGLIVPGNRPPVSAKFPVPTKPVAEVRGYTGGRMHHRSETGIQGAAEQMKMTSISRKQSIGSLEGFRHNAGGLLALHQKEGDSSKCPPPTACCLLACVLSLSLAPSAMGGDAPTYHRDVVRILQKHCQDCHRPGQVAPFSLLTYEQAHKRSSDIVNVTQDRVMPPWHASTSEGGPFVGARVLSNAEKKVLAAWAEASCPEGDPRDEPPAKSWSSEWALGPPDLVLEVPEDYTLDSAGRDEHRVFVIPSGLMEGKWVKAVDFRPGNPRVVHHILAAFDVTGRGPHPRQT